MTDYSAMTGAELLEAYNKISTTKRKAKFPSTAAAIKAIERAEAENGKAAPATNGKGKGKKAADKKAPAKEAATRTSKRATMKIKFLVKENPHKEGTKGHGFFEEMKANPIYGDYIANSSDAKRAREWFGYSLRVGHVKLEG